MSRNTIEILPPIPPTTKPESEEKSEKEKFPYGWRYVTKTLPGGQEIDYKMPLTLEDLLNPQKDDQIPQNPRHAQCSIDIFNMLGKYYLGNPSVGVFYNFKMRWGIKNLEEPAPDVAVIPNLKDKNINSSSFNVKQEQTRPCLVVEVVSHTTSSLDYIRKIEIYEQAGIKEYIIIDPHSEKTKPLYEITGYRLKEGKYLPIKPDQQGCLLSQTTKVLFGVHEDGQRLRLKNSETGEWLLTAQEEKATHLEEQRARLVAEIRLEKAEIRANEAEARANEANVRAAKVETQLEETKARLKEAETRANKTEAQIKKAQQKISQLMEHLRQVGIELIPRS